jgi:Zn-dependent peptidase ImmA (M78 family)
MGLSPAEYAKKLLEEQNIKSAPIYPRKIARELGIYVWERKAESGYDGYMISVDNTWGIMINGAIKSIPRKRFTVAHELGHYYIDYHDELSYRCFGKDMEDISSSTKHDEREANEFAVELLMPYNLFRDDINRHDISLDTINLLAEKYLTSMISTTIRYARCNDYECAIIISEQERIKYFAFSESFGKAKNLYLLKNALLQDGSYAKKLFDTGFSITEGHGEVPAKAWSANTTEPEMLLMEHSRCFPAFNQVISLIWFKKKKEQIAHVLIE